MRPLKMLKKLTIHHGKLGLNFIEAPFVAAVKSHTPHPHLQCNVMYLNNKSNADITILIPKRMPNKMKMVMDKYKQIRIRYRSSGRE